MQFISKDISVGNRAIDSEHIKLHDTITKIGELIVSCKLIVSRDTSALSSTFNLLVTQLQHYFAIEESIAKAGFDFATHRMAHQRFLHKVQLIESKLVAENGILPKAAGKNYIDCLRDCLIQHIKEDGRELKIVLSTYLYDFIS